MSSQVDVCPLACCSSMPGEAGLDKGVTVSFQSRNVNYTPEKGLACGTAATWEHWHNSVCPLPCPSGATLTPPFPRGRRMSQGCHTVQVCSIEVLQAALQGPVWTKLRSEWSVLKPVIQACNWRGGGFAPAMFGREIPAAWVSREKLLPRKAGSLLKSRETCSRICGR